MRDVKDIVCDIILSKMPILLKNLHAISSNSSAATQNFIESRLCCNGEVRYNKADLERYPDNAKDGLLSLFVILPDLIMTFLQTNDGASDLCWQKQAFAEEKVLLKAYFVSHSIITFRALNEPSALSY